MFEGKHPAWIVAGGIAALVTIVGTAAWPVLLATSNSGDMRNFWLSVATVASTTTATIVIGGIALFQTLANARLHREAEAARAEQARRDQDHQMRVEMRALLAERVGDRTWRQWVINLHVDNRASPERERFYRSQFDEIGINYDEFLRLHPDLKVRIDAAVERGERVS